MRSELPGLSLAVLAVVAAHVALVVEVLRSEGSAGWLLAGMLGAANLAIGLAMGLSLRFRRIPLLAILATAALTEALLWRPATSVQQPAWIATAALLGLVALAGCWFAMRWADSKFRSRR